jgi:hypothetical protein
VLHIPAVLQVEDCVASFTIAIDILQYVVLETLSMLLPFENGVPIELIQTASAGLWDELLRVWGGQLGVFALSLRVSLVLLDIAGLVPIPAWIAAMTALYVAWAVLFAC